ncbi:MAG: acetolactate synthase large subunit [Bifidobacteriaceae bacterium]|jgi:acetolactate synthase-1/2/3 large subunit|nr:acetolactate synthase large subunit [Bifidobacteriaceae bacterium]
MTEPKPAPPGGRTGQRLTGAQAIVKTLEALGVEVVFGIPGGAILPTYDPLYASKIRHILVRHEQGAGHAATGYAASSGRVGVCLATSGPGATNLITALADANIDSVPVLAITGQVSAQAIGTDAFQEADIVGATMPLTKHSFLVKRADEIGPAIWAAYHIARSGRPGPVLVDITKSAQTEPTEWRWPVKMELPGYKPVTKPHSKQVKQAAEGLRQAQRPVILAGGGIIRAGDRARADLARLVNRSGAPVVVSLMGVGSLPDAHPANLGMGGMHGSVPAVAALQGADLVLAVGSRFDDRLTGDLASFAPRAKLIHADIDPAEIGKNLAVEIPIVGDAANVLAELAELAADWPAKPDYKRWWEYLNGLREAYPPGYDQPSDGRLAPQFAIERLSALAPKDAIFVAGVGQHQMWAQQFLDISDGRQLLNSGGLGTMGYAVPAAMGARVAHPGRQVWAVDGDGCFQMTGHELVTCALNGIPLKVALINNSSLGMVRQWQTLFYGERYSNTDLQTGDDSAMIPDFVKLADAYGCVGLRCADADQVDRVIEQAMAVADRPALIDFQVSRDAQVWPMIAGGAPNDTIQYARGLAPVFEPDKFAQGS